MEMCTQTKYSSVQNLQIVNPFFREEKQFFWAENSDVHFFKTKFSVLLISLGLMVWYL